MAAINPDPQAVGIPDWNNATRPISQIEGDKSLGIGLGGIGTALKDAGELYKSGVQVQDFLVDTAIQDQVKTRTDQVRDSQIAYNFAKEDQLRNATTAIDPSVAKGAPLDLLQVNNAAEKLPGPIQDVENTANNLATWKADKKFPETVYRARIAQIQKDLRDQYPNYRDYVDKAFSNAGFGIPANELLRAQQADINALMSATGDDSKKLMAEVFSNAGYPDAALMMNKVVNRLPGGDAVGVVNWINRYKSVEVQNAAVRDHLTTKDAVTKDVVANTQQYYSGYLGRESMLATQSETWKGIMADVDAVTNGTKQANEVDWAGNNLKMQSIVAGIRQKAINDANAITPVLDDNGKAVIDPKTGKPQMARLIDRLGPDGAAKLNTLIDDNTKMLTETMGMVNNQQGGAAHAMANLIQQKQQQWEYAAKMGNQGDTIRRLEWAKQFGPEFMQRIVTQDLKNSDYNGLNNALKSISTDAKIRLMTPTAPGTTPAKDTPKQIITDMSDAGVNSPKTVRQVIKTADLIGDKNTPDAVKETIIDKFVDPSNNGMLDLLSVDHVETRGHSKVVVPGRYAAFSTVLSPDNITAAHKAGADTWDKTVKWANNEFTNSLFGPELHTMEGLKNDPRFEFAWDTEKNQIKFNYSPEYRAAAFKNQRFGQPQDIENVLQADPDFQRMNTMKDRINTGIQVMANIAKENGTDVHAYITNVLKTAGYNNQVNKVTGESLPDFSIQPGTPQDTVGALFSRMFFTLPPQRRPKAAQ